jgi:hypothetical protein
LPTPINDLLNRVATPPRFESSLMWDGFRSRG